MAFKLPNMKRDMDRKYGTGEYSRDGKKFEQRMKPGESKFKYNVRMRKQNAKAVDKPVTRTTEQLEGIDSRSEIKGTFSTAETLSGGFNTNSGDLRAPVTTNFDITDEMSFDEAFQQAKLKDIEPGASFDWRGDSYKWELKEENKFGDPFYRGKTNMMTNFQQKK